MNSSARPVRQAAPAREASTQHMAGLLQRQCACGSKTSNVSGECEACAGKRLQSRLAVGPVNDPHEQEADRVANAVMNSPAAKGPVAGSISRVAQRAPVANGTSAGSGTASGAGTVARSAPPVVDRVLASSGTPLGAGVRGFFEERFGHDFGSVRIHDDAQAARSARAVDSMAYTVGEHVVFDHGRYAPDSAEGRRLLAHELTHVVQQGPALRRQSLGLDPQADTSGEKGDEKDDEDRAPEAAATGGLGLQRTPILQRHVAIVGSDEAGPKADLTGQKENDAYNLMMQPIRLAECKKKAAPDPDTCKPKTMPGWSSFNGTPPAKSPWKAETWSHIETVAVPSQECEEKIMGHASGPQKRFQGVFDPDKSWVNAKSLNAADSKQNGSDAIVANCEKHFSDAAAKKWVNVTFGMSTKQDAQCPAGPVADGTKATTSAECATVVAADFTRQAVKESARLLNHEQTHLKLTCALASKANKLLASGTSYDKINAVIHNRLDTAQAQFDAQSKHGCIEAGQSKWESAIADELPDVKLP